MGRAGTTNVGAEAALSRPELRSPAAPSWAVLAVFAITFILYRNAVLNHFYEFGGGTDPLWFSGMLWRGDWALHAPPGIDDRTFHNTHFSPFLLIPALFSHLVGYDHVAWFAIFIGAMHALATAAAAWICWQAARARWEAPWIADVAAAALGFGFAVCGTQAVFMGLPHYEIAIPAFIIALLGALALGRKRAAWFLFVAVLATREDSGIHAATFLLPLGVFVRWQEKRWLRQELLFAALGLVYSIAVILAKPHLFPEGVSFFRINLVGDPPFAHVTYAEISRRVDFLFWQVGRAWIPLALLAVYTLVRRDLAMLAGAIAVIPWIVLHAVFVTHETGATLGYYYVFPILVSLAWPSIVALYRARTLAPGSDSSSWLLLQLAVIAAAFTPPLHSKRPHYVSNYQTMSFRQSEEALNAETYRAFTRALENGRRELGRLAANVWAVSLAPHVLRRTDWIDMRSASDRLDPTGLETLLIFDGYWPCPEVNALVASVRMPNAFGVPGTRIVVLTRKSLDELPTIRPLLAPHPRPLGPFCDRKKLR